MSEIEKAHIVWINPDFVVKSAPPLVNSGDREPGMSLASEPLVGTCSWMDLNLVQIALRTGAKADAHTACATTCERPEEFVHVEDEHGSDPGYCLEHRNAIDDIYESNEEVVEWYPASEWREGQFLEAQAVADFIATEMMWDGAL